MASHETISNKLIAFKVIFIKLENFTLTIINSEMVCNDHSFANEFSLYK